MQLRFEGAVAGVVPVIRVLQESLAAAHVERIHGIVNGTTNYILSEMARAGISYETALGQAQELGYAEADPTDDVTGRDVDGAVTFATRHPARRSVRVTGSGRPTVEDSGLRWHVTLPPRGRTTITVRVEPSLDGVPLRSPYPTGEEPVDSVPTLQHARWRERSPHLRSADAHVDDHVALRRREHPPLVQGVEHGAPVEALGVRPDVGGAVAVVGGGEEAEALPAAQPVEHEGAGQGAVGVLPEARLRLVVPAARLEHLDQPAEAVVVVVPVVVHHRGSGVVRDRDRRELRVRRQPAPQPVRRRGAVGERGEDRGAAGDVVARVRATGGTLVATGGCFDVLHAGHVACLEAARRLGDALVVLVNSDDSVRRLKGAGRPVSSQEDRARVLSALDSVDAVVVFDEDDPRAALDLLRPDVWAKGGDYGGAELPEAPLVRGWGGRVVLLPYLDGRSTTEILRRGAPATVPAEQENP